MQADPPRARPFLKWAGGKTALLPQLLLRAPANYDVFYEPFVGAGALFFALQPNRAVIGDMNQRLMRTYSAIRNSVGEVVQELRSMENEHLAQGKTLFRSCRALSEQDFADMHNVDVAAWMIFLNKTCFNGMYRVNRSGKFNVPYGKYKNPKICDEENLLACSEALVKNVDEIRGWDFEDVVADAKAGDFCYFDPPYAPLSATSDFTSYTADGFTHADQIRLRDCALALKRRGVHVLLSNSSAPSILELYSEGFTIERVLARRNVNSNGAGRGAIEELLIT